GPRHQRRAQQGAEGLAGAGRAAMRLLPERYDHGRGGALEGQAQADRRRHRRGDDQHLSLRHLPAGTRGDPRSGQGVREADMNNTTNLKRRTVMASAAAIGSGFTFGFNVPRFGAQAAETAPELNAWVVIHPDDKVVIRIARSEMGQGTLTGLAQLVAEELDCDWSRVTTEYPTPGQNVARNRVWGNFQTAGSRVIRDSHEYVRKGGAAARQMLIQAA